MEELTLAPCAIDALRDRIKQLSPLQRRAVDDLMGTCIDTTIDQYALSVAAIEALVGPVPSPLFAVLGPILKGKF